MKMFYKIAAVALVMVGFSATANAQTGDPVEATATANATIISPITISHVADMHFGNIVATTAGGTVILGTDDTRTESGVQLPVEPGTVNAAEFTVTGVDGYAYSVTLPADGYAIVANGGGTPEDIMTISDWSHNATEILTGGGETFKVGATLTVVPDQNAGTYVGEDNFAVTVNYN